MYYEEATINNVLHWRNTPDGAWTPFTLEALSIALKSEKAMNNNLRMEVEEARDILTRIRELAG